MKKNTNTLTTFVIGQRYETLWNTYCKALWVYFASRYGYELVVINKMLRADNRLPAWQKLALPEYVANAEQVLFVDADIVFSKGALSAYGLVKNISFRLRSITKKRHKSIPVLTSFIIPV